jgi:hypothetical protein
LETSLSSIGRLCLKRRKKKKKAWTVLWRWSGMTLDSSRKPGKDRNFGK